VNQQSTGGRRELFTVYPDGSGVESLRCDHGHDRAEGRQISSGDVVFRADGKLRAFVLVRFASRLAAAPGWRDRPVAEAEPGQWLFSARRPGQAAVQVVSLDTSNRHLSGLDGPPEGSVVQPVVVARRTPPRDFPSASTENLSGRLTCCACRLPNQCSPIPE
jgi:hypothetical protein